jgi:hypothetical protein
MEIDMEIHNRILNKKIKNTKILIINYFMLILSQKKK